MAKRKRLPPMQWREIEASNGNARWQTLDGMFMLVCQDQYQGIVLPRIYVLWQFKRGSFWKVEERRSRDAIEKCAKVRNAQLNSDDE